MSARRKDVRTPPIIGAAIRFIASALDAMAPHDAE